MRCAWVQDRLLLYLARELGAQEAEQVRAHLQKCALCAVQAEQLTEIQERVDIVLQTQAEAPARLEGRVMEVGTSEEDGMFGGRWMGIET